MKYHTIWSINQNIRNYDITRYISTFIFYKPITRDIMKLKIKNNEFEDMKDEYGSIENWNVSNVTNMMAIFYNCKNFNQNLSKWNVSNVTNMEYMFSGCEKFNQKISNWNVSNVTNMRHMFYDCNKLTIKPTWSAT